jgi:zinc transporter ZupT
MIEKIAAALFLAIETLLFAMLPYFYSKISNEKMIRIFNCFSAGLFLGMAFLHILPEGNEAISNFFANHN